MSKNQFCFFLIILFVNSIVGSYKQNVLLLLNAISNTETMEVKKEKKKKHLYITIQQTIPSG